MKGELKTLMNFPFFRMHVVVFRITIRKREKKNRIQEKFNLFQKMTENITLKIGINESI